MQYNPTPMDVSDVILPESLSSLIESLAESVHNTWTKGRMDEGWTYGTVRNDVEKQHPCLIPYSELPESEKAYDRQTAISTLKFIYKMGYRISR